MGGKLKYYLILQLIVLFAGFTGVLGDYITLDADYITFFRTGIATLSLLLIGLFIKKSKPTSRKLILMFFLTGFIVGLHWYTFFYSIKVSTVSVGVVCMSSATLFTSFLEPIIFKRKFLIRELILSIAIIAGLVIISQVEGEYYLGLITGLISAFLAALFNVLNGKFVGETSSFTITKYEILGAFSLLAVILFANGKIHTEAFNVSTSDWVYLLILGLVCTTFAFMVSVWVMKFVTPFTVSMSLNMEPIYAIIIVLIIDSVMGTHEEEMTKGFYVGTVIIIGSIFTNAYFKKRNDKSKRLSKNTSV